MKVHYYEILELDIQSIQFGQFASAGGFVAAAVYVAVMGTKKHASVHCWWDC